LQKLLADARGSKEENVINEVAIRSMAKAIYSEKNIGHFGLSFDHYTHFTSPIRRYPDLMVHRLLDEYAHGMTHARREELVKQLPTECKWCSDRERVAMEAERASVKVMQVEYMRDRVGEVYEAVVSGVAPYGLFIEINDVLVEGLLHMRNLGDDYYRYDEKQFSITGERQGRTFRLGDAIRVVVFAVDVGRRMIDFALAPDEKAGKPLPRLKFGTSHFVPGKKGQPHFVHGKKNESQFGRDKKKSKGRRR
jgi:ribonuclease R